MVAIYPYTRDASTVWELCADTPGLTLWQVQMEHNVTANSFTVGFYESFTKFLEQNEDTPDILRELSEQAMIKLVLADRISFSFMVWCVCCGTGRRAIDKKTSFQPRA